MNEDESTKTAAALSSKTEDKKTGDEDSTENVTAKRLAIIEEGLSVLAREILSVKSLPLATERLSRGHGRASAAAHEVG